ncbi:MAG: hypothetical protein E6Q78_09560 [Rhodoferax sp.]|nr:MAG: hypothetical protein E6Q78_09560 [Rhodoferax sp.]
MGKTILSKELIDQGVAVYSAGFSDEPWGYIPSSDVLFGEETLVVSARGNIGIPKLPRVHPFVCTQTTIAISLHDAKLRKYVFYFLKSLDYSPFTSQTTIPMIRVSDVNEIAVPLFDEVRRERVVAELEKQFSRLDEAVANLQRVKANLKRYKASVLKAAVEGRLVETEASLAHREGRTFENGEQLLQRILKERRETWKGKGRYKEPVAQTDDFTIAVPDGWTSATVDQLGSVQLGKMLDKQKHTAGAPYQYLRNINVRWGAFDVSDVFEMNFEPDELERFSVRAGDVLVCEGGEPARAAVWRSKQMDMKYQKALHRVRFDGAYLPDLLVIALEHLAKSGALDELYGGSTIKHFTLETFIKLVLPVPPAAEQARIVAEVDRHLSIIREVEAEVDANLQRAQALRQATLAKAFVV